MDNTHIEDPFGPLTPLMDDPDVREIFVDGPYKVYVERKGKLEDVSIQFDDEAHLMNTIQKISSTESRLIEANPMFDVRLPDGSRANVILPPLALNGPTLTIAKFEEDKLTIDDLIRFGSIPSEAAAFLKACVQARLNIVVAGGVGSGKTSLLNVMASFIPDEERIITVETMATLQLKHKRVVSLESRPPDFEGKGEVTVRDLLLNSLKMRPDRIIVGEVRGSEVLDLIQAMNSGIDGAMTSLHANSPRDALSRLETLITVDNLSIPVLTIREMIASAINLVVQQTRLRDGSRKVVRITEVQGMQGDVFALADLLVFEQEGIENGKIIGRLKPTGVQPRFLERIKAMNLSLPPNLFDTPPDKKKIKVLIVDDIEETRENLRKLLYFEKDIEVVGSAANGEEGVELARRHQPDIVLMDLRMPGIDGITATERITQNVPAAQVIIMATEGEEDALERARQAGARDILIKPFTSTGLIEGIHQVYTVKARD